jgi:tetratricopeptide (TPR) repeat protein
VLRSICPGLFLFAGLATAHAQSDALAGDLDAAARAEVALANAEYYYRAEMKNRKFVQATHYAAALPYFRRSLDYRQQAGAIDPALFAAITLASTLVELDRAEEALPHLEYAAGIAESIDSAAGRSRVRDIAAGRPCRSVAAILCRIRLHKLEFLRGNNM